MQRIMVAKRPTRPQQPPLDLRTPSGRPLPYAPGRWYAVNDSMSQKVWGYREGSGYRDDIDLVGFHVEALDGSVGHVIHSSTDGPTATYIVVDVGHWIFGRHVVLPAGAVSRIVPDLRTVFVDRTRQEIRDAPELAQLMHHPEDEHLNRLGGYYSKFYAEGKV